LREFKDRICQLHVSEVRQRRQTRSNIGNCTSGIPELADELPRDVPVILELPVDLESARDEIRQAARIFDTVPTLA
jgi:hypothetical protein